MTRRESFPHVNFKLAHYPTFWKWSPLDFLYRSYLASLMLHILMVLVIVALGILLLLFVPGPLRQAELAALHQALQQAGAGHGQVVAVSGEPGVGPVL